MTLFGGLIKTPEDRAQIASDIQVRQAQKLATIQQERLRDALTQYGGQGPYSREDTLSKLATSGPVGQAIATAELQTQMPGYQQAQQMAQVQAEREAMLFEVDYKNKVLENQQLQREINSQTMVQPDRMTVPVLGAGPNGTQAVNMRTVDTPSSNAYMKTMGQMDETFKGLRSITELKELVGLYGSEMSGFGQSDRMKALQRDAVLGYAQAKGMGALQEPDLKIAEGVLPDPLSLGANLRGVLGSTIGAIDAAGAFIGGGDSGLFGMSRADQIRGYQSAYDVALEGMWEDVVRTILRNPLYLDDISDEDLRMIPPDVAAPIEPYLRMRKRDPWSG